MKSNPQNTLIPSRRSFLKSIGGSSVGLALGGGLGLAACTPKSSTQNFSGDYSAMAQQNYPFYGAHQAGIVTPAQRSIYFLVLDLHTQDIEEIKAVFKQWTESAAKLTRGENIQPYGDNPFVPPVDTGEADDLGAYGLTLTFGVSPE